MRLFRVMTMSVGIARAQEQLAKNFSTTTNGTSYANMRTALNGILKSSGLSHQLAPVAVPAGGGNAVNLANYKKRIVAAIGVRSSSGPGPGVLARYDVTAQNGVWMAGSGVYLW